VAVSLDSTVSISEDAVFRELEGEAVIVHLDSGMYYGLDPVGTRLWQLIDAHGQLHPVFDAALEEFDVEPERLQHDLLQLVSELAGRQLVVVR
jgi:Coenzyme PQQ synthesis protein D (PqqD)